jgi:hypothetical protein
LFNGLQDNADQDEWMGMIQTFKIFISESVIDKINTLVKEQAKNKEDVKEIIKSEMKEIKDQMTKIVEMIESKNK